MYSYTCMYVCTIYIDGNRELFQYIAAFHKPFSVDFLRIVEPCSPHFRLAICERAGSIVLCHAVATLPWLQAVRNYHLMLYVLYEISKSDTENLCKLRHAVMNTIQISRYRIKSAQTL